MVIKIENEVWKSIPGFENKYEVSNIGRVRSLPRLAPVKNFKRKWVLNAKETELSLIHKKTDVVIFTFDLLKIEDISYIKFIN